MSQRDEWTVVGGALSTFFAGGRGPSTADIESAFDLASYDEPLADLDANNQRRVAAALLNGYNAQRREIAQEMIDRLRERGVFDAGSREADKIGRLRTALARAGYSLTEDGYLDGYGVSGPALVAPAAPATSGGTPPVAPALPQVVTHPVDVGDLEKVLRRVPAATRSLMTGRHGRAGVDVRNEYGAQDLVECALRLVDDDVRAEEPASSVAGSSSIIDFLLPARRTAVEVKVTRPGRSEKKIKEELVVDFYDFGVHPDVDRVVAVVYDLAGTFKNPAGFEAGLTGEVNGIETKAIVCRWPASGPASQVPAQP